MEIFKVMTNIELSKQFLFLNKRIDNTHRFVLFMLIIFAIIVNTATVNAAQFINALPVELNGNWTICQFTNESTVINKNNSYPKCQISETVNIIAVLDDKKTTLLESDASNQIIINNRDLIGSNYTLYSKQFIVSGELQKTTLAIFTGPIDEADEIRVNGHLIGKTGSFPPFFQGAYRQDRLYSIPSYTLKFNQFNLLEIKTFNSINKPGLNHHAVSINEYFKLEHNQQKINYFYVSAIAILLLLAFIQIFHFWINKRSNETLYLAVFLIILSLVTFARSHAPNNIGFDLNDTYKIEMFLISMGMISISFFLFRFFELEVRKNYVILFILMALIGILNLIWPFSSSIRLLAELSYWAIIILTFFTGGNAVLIAFIKKREYSVIIGILNTCSWSALVFDSLIQSQFLLYSQLPNNPFFLPLAAVAIGLGMSLAVTHKYWQAFKGATYDHLTGTLLRPSFFQRLSEELQRSQRDQRLLLVAVIHISQFKTFNADYGYIVGNKLLLTVSETLTRVLKPFDLICHLSDDEFCIAASSESRPIAKQTIEQMHKSIIAIEHQIDKNTKVFIDVKIGGIIYNPDHHLSVSQLLQDANYGLAKVKSQNKADYILLNNPTVRA